jgi:hypothetical protein
MNYTGATKHFAAIDLKKYMNHKFVYDAKSTECILEKGIDNLYLPLDIFQRRVISKNLIKNVKYQFEIGEFDNIECMKQEISVNEIGKTLYILGFSCYGDMRDCVKLVYGEKIVEKLIKQSEVSFNRRKIKAESSMEIEDNDIISAFTIKSTTRKGMTINFCVYALDLLQEKLDRIILPDNSFMHIFAMTLEKE